MHPDDDSELRAAFAELHRRRRALAPSFEAMRERVLCATNEARVSAAPAARLPILRWAAGAAAACGIMVVIWQLAPGPKQARPEMEMSAARVDQLIDQIEQSVEYHSVSVSSEYPSDVLLHTDPDSSL